ncbi:hypothetical protein QBC34DRAFT_387218 [Podospora aff. communis PSN243]|uniref:BTB domain-containing protein n=1 Tax=Podospora aff. communis PSN243 TaxID=3040156 RepID=A0AAV9G2H3_9PEZI|nr:hypothetical protein QBC34DRAFT_387218 [Podospora aff. communis PSN243]
MDTPSLTTTATSPPSSPFAPLNPPSAALTTSTDTILLNVSGTPFITTIGTLTSRSHFFAALFSGRWPIPLTPITPSTFTCPTTPVPPDHSRALFVDSDPGVFSHLLRYLRRGVFPLSYTSTGHDLHLYAALLPESLYFQCDALTLWLQDELYLRCVEHTSVWKRLSDTGLGTETWGSEMGVQLVKRKVSEEHKWVCPSSLRQDSHRLVYGHGLCGDPTNGVVNRVERTEWMEYGTKREVRRGWCWDEGQEFRDYYERECEKEVTGSKGSGVTVDSVRTL